MNDSILLKYILVYMTMCLCYIVQAPFSYKRVGFVQQQDQDDPAAGSG
jgi:hypothetical protein